MKRKLDMVDYIAILCASILFIHGIIAENFKTLGLGIIGLMIARSYMDTLVYAKRSKK